MAGIDSSFEPHGSSLPENNLLDPNSAHDILTATAGYENNLDAAVKKSNADAMAAVRSLRPAQSGVRSGAEGLKRGNASPVYYNPKTKKFSVGGKTFDEGDYQSAVASEALVNDPNTPAVRPNDGGDWRPLPRENFASYIEKIKNPTRGELLSKNFEMGTQQLKSLGGSALAAAGFEETGQAISDEADKQAGYYQPYVREFTEINIGEEGGVGRSADWFVSVLGSQGPQILESVAVGLAGAAAGTATAGPGVGTFGGFIAGLFGKKEFKKQVLAAAKRHRGGVASAADKALLKQAGSIAGASMANAASGYTMGVGDIFGEATDEGFDASDARLKALAGGAPYALAEMLPEFVAAGKLLAGGTRASRAMPAGTGKAKLRARKGAHVAGTAAGLGALEGVTEASQEALVMGLTDQDLTSPEAIHRLINSAAAGIAVGGVMGGVASIPTVKEFDLLQGQTVESGAAPTGTDGDTPAPAAPAAPAPNETLSVDQVWAAMGRAGINVSTEEKQDAIAAQFSDEEIDSGQFSRATVDAIIAREGAPAPAAPITEPAAAPLVADDFDAALAGVEQEYEGGPLAQVSEATDEEFDAALAQPAEAQPAVVEDFPIIEPVVAPPVAVGAAKLQKQGKPKVVDAAEEAWDARRKVGAGGDTTWAKVPDEVKKEWSAAVADTSDPGSLNDTFTNLRNKGQNRGRPKKQDLSKYTYGTAEEAAAAAESLGLVGSHESGDGTFMPGKTHEALVATIDAEAKEAPTKKEEAAPAPTKKAEAKVELAPTKKVEEEAAPAPDKKAEVAPEVSDEQKQFFTGLLALIDKLSTKIDTQQKQSPEDELAAALNQAETSQRKDKAAEEVKKARPEEKADKQAKEKAKPARRAEPKDIEDTSFDDSAIAQYENKTNEQLDDIIWDSKDHEEYSLVVLELLSRAFIPNYAASTRVADRAAKLADMAMKDAVWVNHMVTIAQTQRNIDAQSPLGQLLLDSRNEEIYKAVKRFNGGVDPISRITQAEAEEAVVEATKLDDDLGKQDKLVQSLASKISLALNSDVEKVSKPNITIRKEVWPMLYEDIKAIGRENYVLGNGKRISDYFTDGGDLKLDARGYPTTKELSAADIAAAIDEKDKIQQADQKAKQKEQDKDIYERIEDLRAQGLANDEIVTQLPKESKFNKIQVQRALGTDEGVIQSPDVTMDDNWEDLAYRDQAAAYDEDIMFSRVDDGKPVGVMSVGKVMLAAKAIEGRMRIKPVFTYVKDAADLKKRFPTLYNEINNARVKKDLAQIRAAGVSHKGNVVIFSDNIQSTQHLAFVMGHEAIGHFGFRSMVPANVLNSILDTIYNDSDMVRNAVDEALAVAKSRGESLSKREAVEEHLADMAGILETSILKRFWYAVKDFINKVLGVQVFPDETARYMVSRARRYVTHGEIPPVDVLVGKISKDVVAFETMTDPENSAFYSQSGAQYSDQMHAAAGSVNDLYNVRGLKSLQDKYLNKVKDIPDLWDRLKATLEPMNYMARENLGYEQFFKYMRDMVQRVNFLRTKYNQALKIVLTPRAEQFGIHIGGGISEAELLTVNNMLADNTLSKMHHLSEEDQAGYKLLRASEDGSGQLKIDMKVLAALQKKGRRTLKEFQEGFSYMRRETHAMDANGSTVINARRAEKLKGVTDQAEIDNLNARFDADLTAETYYTEVKVDVPKIEGLTADSLVWRGFVGAYKGSNMADLDLLRANIIEFTEKQDTGHREIEKVLGRDITALDRETLQIIANRHSDLIELDAANDTDVANDFMVGFNKTLIGEGIDRIKPFVDKFIEPAERGKVLRGIVGMRKDSVLPGNTNEAIRYNVQAIIHNEALQQTSVRGAEKFAKSSIGTGHMRLGRGGQHEVYIHAVDPKTQQVYKVNEEFRNQFVYMRMDSASEAEQMATELGRVLNQANTKEEIAEAQAAGVEINTKAETLYTIMVEVDEETESGGVQKVFRPREVKLVPKAQKAQELMPDPMGANLNEVVSTLARNNVQLHPKARGRLVKQLTAQNDRARQKLLRVGAPGFERHAMVRYLSEKLEGVASTVSRKEHRNKVAELLNTSGNVKSKEMWYGTQAEYDRRKKLSADAANDPRVPLSVKKALSRSFDKYHYTYKVKNSDKTAKKYLDMASRDLAFLDSQNSVEFSDFSSGEIGAQVRMWTTFAQLGGSVATGMLNIISLQTNVVPVLATYNPDKAFGGGFGLAKSQAELMYALGQVKNHKQSDAAYWDNLVKDENAREAAGFTDYEARFMAAEVKEGTMAAALMNALLGSSRGKITTGAAQKGIQAWMSMFSYTEQVSRRGTGLAAFRLHFERGIQEHLDSVEGLNDRADIDVDSMQRIADEAKTYATDLIDQTLGEYAMFNRPAFWRGDVRQFIFMYKMFPLVSIMLMSQLPKSGQLLFLGTLLMLGGVKGLPFGEDLMDIVDTIAQGLGLGPSKIWKGSAERTVAEALHSVAPSITPELMRGWANIHLGVNLSDRVSVGNMIPGTGLGLAGADQGRELMEIAGPIASFIQNSIVTAGNVIKYGAESVGLKDDTTTFTEILRQSPFTMMRAYGDTRAYNHAGAIVNSRGYVVSEDLTAATYASRMLGFYPAAATMNNDVVRVSKRVTDYNKERTAAYRSMFIAARLDTNRSRGRKQERRVVKMVDEWNKVARGTGMEISNFVKNSQQAYKQATMPTAVRFQKSLPKNSKVVVDEMLDIMGF